VSRAESRAETALDELCIKYGYCGASQKAEAKRFSRMLPTIPTPLPTPFWLPRGSNAHLQTKREDARCTKSYATGSLTGVEDGVRSPGCCAFPPPPERVARGTVKNTRGYDLSLPWRRDSHRSRVNVGSGSEGYCQSYV
jgi:hypothetical protein